MPASFFIINNPQYFFNLIKSRCYRVSKYHFKVSFALDTLRCLNLAVCTMMDALNELLLSQFAEPSFGGGHGYVALVALVHELGRAELNGQLVEKLRKAVDAVHLLGLLG